MAEVLKMSEMNSLIALKLEIEDRKILSIIYADVPRSERLQAITDALTKVGLSDRLNSRPNQLSGGQQQRPCACKSSCFSVGR